MVGRENCGGPGKIKKSGLCHSCVGNRRFVRFTGAELLLPVAGEARRAAEAALRRARATRETLPVVVCGTKCLCVGKEGTWRRDRQTRQPLNGPPAPVPPATRAEPRHAPERLSRGRFPTPCRTKYLCVGKKGFAVCREEGVCRVSGRRGLNVCVSGKERFVGKKGLCREVRALYVGKTGKKSPAPCGAGLIEPGMGLVSLLVVLHVAVIDKSAGAAVSHQSLHGRRSRCEHATGEA